MNDPTLQKILDTIQPVNEIEARILNDVAKYCVNTKDAMAYLRDLNAENFMSNRSQTKEFYNEYFFAINDIMQEWGEEIGIGHTDLIGLAYKICNWCIWQVYNKFKYAVEEGENEICIELLYTKE